MCYENYCTDFLDNEIITIPLKWNGDLGTGVAGTPQQWNLHGWNNFGFYYSPRCNYVITDNLQVYDGVYRTYEPYYSSTS